MKYVDLINFFSWKLTKVFGMQTYMNLFGLYKWEFFNPKEAILK